VPAIVAEGSDKNAEKTVDKKQVTRKRTIDKWKKKSWYTVFAPKEFDRKELGTTVAEKPQSVEGRVFEISARTLSGDIKKSHITLIFKIDEVKGNKAYTQSIGHEVKDSYLRKFVRRRNAKIEVIKFVETKDNVKVKVKAMVLTSNRIERKKRTAIRKIMSEKIESAAKSLETQQLVSELVFGNLPQKIFNDAKKVGPIKRVEITKSRILSKK